MKSCPASLLLFAAIQLPLHPADFTWPDTGVISLPPAPGWSVRGQPADGGAFNLKGTPDSGANAELMITLFSMPADKPVVVALLKDAILEAVRPQLGTAVEKSPVPQEIKLPGGGGWYVQMTDSTLVGKPAVRGKFKVARSAMLAVDAHALAIVTMFFDDPAGPEPAAMLAQVQGMRLRRSSEADSLTLMCRDGRVLVTTPESRVVLSLPQRNLRATELRKGGGTTPPRYFLMEEGGSGLSLSGWFEPAEAFWKEEKSNLLKGTDLTVKDESMAKEGEWTVVYYTVPLPGPLGEGAFLNCRAECVKDGTWIDLHLSMPASKRARKTLSGILTDARFEAKR